MIVMKTYRATGEKASVLKHDDSTEYKTVTMGSAHHVPCPVPGPRDSWDELHP